MTRIIAGRSKGRRLRTPAGPETRPTADRVRQTLFDILAPAIDGARFLDLFAGSGGVGLEAASRGASRVILVEKSHAAFDVARGNAAALGGAAGQIEVLHQDAMAALGALARRGFAFDIVFLDPPYASHLYEPTLEAVGGELLAEDGLVVAEHFHKRGLPATIGGLAQTRSVRVGDHRLSFYRRVE